MYCVVIIGMYKLKRMSINRSIILKQVITLVLIVIITSVSFISCQSSTEPSDKSGAAQDFSFSVQNFRNYNVSNSAIPDNLTRTITTDNQNNIWIGTYEKGIAKFDGSVWTVYNTGNSGLPCDSVWAIKADLNNNIWIGTRNGLAKFDGTNWTVYNTSNSPLPYKVVMSLAVDKNNILWVGCGHATGGGLLSFDGHNWRLYTTENSSLPCSIINTIHVDKDNNKWVGTGIFQSGGGLVKIDNQNKWNVCSMNNSPILYNCVDEIDSDAEGSIWISQNAWFLSTAGAGGFQRIKKNSWTDFRPNPQGRYDSSAFISNRVDAIKCDRNGYVWVATEPEGKLSSNLSLFKNGVWKTISEIKKDFVKAYIGEMLIDKNGTLWMASHYGVTAFDYTVNEK